MVGSFFWATFFEGLNQGENKPLYVQIVDASPANVFVKINIFYHRICFSYKNVDVCKKPELYIFIFDRATTILSSKIQSFQFFPKIGLSDKKCENSIFFQDFLNIFFLEAP